MSRIKRTIPEKIRRTLTERILAGRYQPGEKLVELSIAREFDVSQASVREALKQLEASRLVESTPRRGTRVRAMNESEMRDAYAVRAVLEEASAVGAAARFRGNVTCLQTEVDGVLAACRDRNFARQARHVYNIHRKIVEASGNDVLVRVWESLALETRVRIRLNWNEVDPAVVEKSYALILDALYRGDAAAVGRYLRNHAQTFSPQSEAVTLTLRNSEQVSQRRRN